MPIIIVACALVYLCVILHVSSINVSPETKVVPRDNSVIGERSAQIISEPVFSGLRAAKQLLHSAQLNQKRNGFDVYDKTGNVLQAYRDFYALHPKNVKALPRGMGKAGVVGDRKIQVIRGRKDKTFSLITIRQGERLLPEHIIIYGHKIPDTTL